ncbi:DUF4937 domain-containing protein [Streptacidiphilus sp. 4-A2]|nr:DUF4937 domain-containing protein [Streptacidiphilus sp. 4-A2]
MWIKWINCTVPAATREQFSTAQCGWSVISDQPGLVGQAGGWDPAGGHARLLALWADADAYQGFVRERHAAVVADIQQGDSYTALDIAAGESLFELSGDKDDLPRALEHATLLRVCDVRLVPGRETHFLDVLRGSDVPGTLAGVVTRIDPQRCLVATLWSDPATHGHYVSEELPGLRSAPGSQAISGRRPSRWCRWKRPGASCPSRDPRRRHLSRPAGTRRTPGPRRRRWAWVRMLPGPG